MEGYLSKNDEQSESPESPLLSKTQSVWMRSLDGTFCVMSRAIFVIFLWSVLVGSVHFCALNAALSLLIDVNPLMDVDASLPFVIVFSLVAIVSIFYPVNGFLADVYCGRYKMIIVSLGIVWFSLIAALLAVVISNILECVNVVVYVMSGSGLLIAILGVTGYGANFIQFGLDQLLEAPSQHQAIFVHWAKWCYDLLSAVLLALYVVRDCEAVYSTSRRALIYSSLTLSIFLLLFIIVFSCLRHHWFYTEPGHRNPYRTVVNVLKFAWKHKYPLQRSAFTYCDDERPSRLDFAKERFGGPFSTEQVEDVKTLLRIIAVLLSIGPIFTMELMTSNATLIYIGLHIGTGKLKLQCGWQWAVLYSGVLQYVVSAIFLPIYVWICFKLLWKRVPKIFLRMGIGITLYILGTLSMIAVDSGGHVRTEGTDCFFSVHTMNNSLVIPSLGMHWSTLIPSDILLGIGSTLVIVTVFEFISAQSPHSMKGLLFGIFFGIRGIFQSVSSIALFPFTSRVIWGNRGLSPISCLSGYFIFTVIAALFGFILFLILAKRYRYRQRDDRPYDQHYVIDFYSRVIEDRHRMFAS